MSILVRFPLASGATPENYDEAIRRLEQLGDFPPDGLEHHVSFIADDGVRVSEIWESPEQMQAFGQRLMPVLDELGIDLAGEPEILPVHYIIDAETWLRTPSPTP